MRLNVDEIKQKLEKIIREENGLTSKDVVKFQMKMGAIMSVETILEKDIKPYNPYN